MIFILTGRSKGRNVILPKIDNGRNHGKSHGKRSSLRKSRQISSRSSFDPSTPLTLELKHGSQMHKVRLPTENLDKSKKYYVTFTIDKANSSSFSDDVIEEKSFEESESGQENMINQVTTHVIPQVESR